MNVGSISNNNFGANYSAIINNKAGLHMTPSSVIAKISKLANKPVYFATNTAPERNVQGSMISILTLEPTCGKEIKVRVNDDYPKDILKSILDCISASDDNAVKKILERFKDRISLIG